MTSLKGVCPISSPSRKSSAPSVGQMTLTPLVPLGAVGSQALPLGRQQEESLSDVVARQRCFLSAQPEGAAGTQGRSRRASGSS
jgi:hypothetical protein